MSRSPHTWFRKGTPVRVVMKDGTVHYGRFVDAKSLYFVLDNCKLKRTELKTATIHKPRPHEMKENK